MNPCLATRVSSASSQLGQIFFRLIIQFLRTGVAWVTVGILTYQKPLHEERNPSLLYHRNVEPKLHSRTGEINNLQLEITPVGNNLQEKHWNTERFYKCNDPRQMLLDVKIRRWTHRLSSAQYILSSLFALKDLHYLQA
jgi:hypothetical protein